MYKNDFSIPEGAQLPTPVGYKILVMVPILEDKTKGGIIRPDALKAAETTASIAVKVLALGKDAYSDPDKFPYGPWCQVGDVVITRAYSGTRFDIGDREFRIINDDSVEGVVPDITQLARK
jgi:co-chaperonin GroES (HSP10)